MIKKIALAAALAASSSFATYTFFPVGENHTGQVEVGETFIWTDEPVDFSTDQIKVGGEFVVIPNLAIGITGLGYQLWSEPDDCDGCDDSDGLLALTLGARYWFMPILGVAVDVSLPLNSEDAVGKYDPLAFYVAAQFSKDLIPNLIIGAEAGLTYKLEDEDKSEGLGLRAQVELDYVISSIGLVPWIGAEFDMRISDVEDGNWEGGSGDNSILLWIGAGKSFGKLFTLKANFLMNFADEKETMGTDWMGINVKGAFSF